MPEDSPRRTIGWLAKQAGVKIATVRFYERNGLLDDPPRTASRHRRYPEEAVHRLAFIQRAKALGFTLSETRELLELFDAPDTGCSDVQECAEEKLRDVQARLRDLRRVEKALRDLTRACRGEGPLAGCLIVRALQGGPSKPKER